MLVQLICYYADGDEEKVVESFKDLKEAEDWVVAINHDSSSFDPIYEIDRVLDEEGAKGYIEEAVQDALINGAAVNCRILKALKAFKKEYGYYPLDFKSERLLKETENHNLNVYKGWE